MIRKVNARCNIEVYDAHIVYKSVQKGKRQVYDAHVVDGVKLGLRMEEYDTFMTSI